MTVAEHVATMQPVNIFVGALDEASNGTDDQNTSRQIVWGFNGLNDLLRRKKLRSTGLGLNQGVCFRRRIFRQDHIYDKKSTRNTPPMQEANGQRVITSIRGSAVPFTSILPKEAGRPVDLLLRQIPST